MMLIIVTYVGKVSDQEYILWLCFGKEYLQFARYVTKHSWGCGIGKIGHGLLIVGLSDV